jgi:hypothetical protein
VEITFWFFFGGLYRFFFTCFCKTLSFFFLAL